MQLERLQVEFDGPVARIWMAPGRHGMFTGTAKKFRDSWQLASPHSIIFDELVYGRFEEPARSYFQQVIAGSQRRGTDAAVLAHRRTGNLAHHLAALRVVLPDRVLAQVDRIHRATQV